LGKAGVSKREQPVLKKEKQSKPLTTLKWFSIGGLLGYFFLHPCIMIIANLMFLSGPASGLTLGDTIVSACMRSFSFQMLPWSLSFAIITGLSGAFYGRNRQVAAALRESEKKFKELSITDGLTGLYNSRHFFFRLNAEIERSNRYGHPLSLFIIINIIG